MATPSEESEKAKRNLEEITGIVDAIRDGFGDLADRFVNVVDEIKDGSTELNYFNNITNNVKKSIRELNKSGIDLIKNQIALNNRTLNTKDIDEQINKIVSVRTVLQSRLQNLQEKISRGVSATPTQYAEINRLTSLINESSQEIEDHLRAQRIEAEKLSEAINNINKSLGLAGNILKGTEIFLNKIGLGALNSVINFKQINQQLQTQAALLTNNGQSVLGFGGKIKMAGSAISLMGKALFKSLSDPAVLMGGLINGFKMFLDIGFKTDTQVTKLSKSMAVSKDQAMILRDRFIEIQNTGQSLFLTTENLVNAQLELADAFGITRGFSDQQLTDQVLLTKQIGLSVDEAASLQQLAMANNQTADDIVNTTLKQTASLAKQTGIQLNNKKILGEVAKVSGQLRLQYQNNPDLIAKAVIQTQKLGISLDQAAKSAKSLLNFEESISDQISAELITGKQLNLERARLLALNGDVAGSMQDMLSQIGSAADFSAMNVIQQEALAKAVGMTSDELANSLVQQENLSRIGLETRKQIEEQVNEYRKKGEVEKANQLLASLGNEQEAEEALKRISAQETFNAAVEKLKAMLSSIVEGPAMNFINAITRLISDTDKLKNILITIKAIALGIAAAWAIMNPLGALAGLAVAGTIMALNDGEINSDGLVVGKYNKGQIQPIAQGRADDNVIFTTNKISNNANNAGNNDNLSIEMREIKSILSNILNIDKQIASNINSKSPSVMMDSTNVGTAINMGTYSIQ